MMKLPNKIYSYRDSSISKFTPVLESIPNEGVSIIMLYFLKKNIFIGIEEYIDVLTCLYALGVITTIDGIIILNK